MKDFKFKINGNEYNVEIEEIVENIAHIQVNGAKYEVEMEKRAETQRPAPVRKPATVQSAPVVQPTSAGGAGKPVKSPLPGVILKVLVHQGDVVKKGQTVVVMEAMKMENNIASELDGVISVIKVKEGQAVLQDEVLVEIS